jgi:hypothetical protein
MKAMVKPRCQILDWLVTSFPGTSVLGFRCRRHIDHAVRGPRWPEITETLPITMAASHLAAHLLLVRLLSVPSVSCWFLYILIRWKVRKGSLTNSIGAEPGVSGTASRSLPRHADISHCAIAEKLPLCRGNKSPGQSLTCGAVCAMDRKWRCGGGTVQVQCRPGGPEASADGEGGPEEQSDHEGQCSLIPHQSGHRLRLQFRGARLRRGPSQIVPWGRRRQVDRHTPRLIRYEALS